MLTRITNSKLFSKLKDKKYRNLFIAGEVRRTVPFQLRALRSARTWTQADLGIEAEMPQTVISRIENGDAASLNIKTLLKLAAAFDVALVVRFEPIDRLVHWVDSLSPEVISPRPSAEVLDEMEGLAEVQTVAAILGVRGNGSGTAVNYLRGLASTSVSTSAVQRTFAFDSPSLVVEMDQGVISGQQPRSTGADGANSYLATSVA